MKKLFLLVFLICVSGINLTQDYPLYAKESPKEFRIGAALALSGPLAMYGVGFRNGTQMVADYFNAKGGLRIGSEMRKVVVLDADTKFTPEGATTAARRLVDSDKVDMIVGAIATPQTLGVQSVTEPGKVLTLHSAAAAETLIGKKYSFRSYISLNETFPSIFSWLVKNRPNVKRMALLDLDYETSHYGHSLAIKAAEKYGIEIVYDEYYPGDTKDFSPFLIKAFSKNPDLIFDTGTGGIYLALLVKQARDMGYKGLFMEPRTPATKTNLEVAGAKAIEGMLGFGYASSGEGVSRGVKAFREAYTKRYGQWAEESLVVAVPLSAILLGYEKAGTMETEQVINVLEAGHEWTTPYGITGVFAGAKDYGRPRQWFAPQRVIITTRGKAIPIGLISLDELLKGWE